MSRRLGRSEQGATTTEFALLLPVLLLFMMLIIEGGRVLNTWMILTNEVREAARYGIAGIRDNDSNLASEVTSYTVSQISTMLDTTPLQVIPSIQGTSTNPTSVTVVATYNVQMITPLMQALKPSIPVTVRAVMRAE